MFKYVKATLAAALLSLSAANLAPAHAEDWAVNSSTSTIGFAGTHAGSTFEGVFEDWSATIHFDPADLASADVRVVIKTGSAVTGNGLYDGTLPSEDWLNSKGFSDAVFTAATFESTGADTYTANGSLELKGKSFPLTLAFTLAVDGDTAHMTATHTLNRIDYGVGVSADADGAWVSKDITLNIDVKATK